MSQQRPTELQATLFAESYILYGDKTKAFRHAFPDSKGSTRNAQTKASLVSNTAMVLQRIEFLREKAKKQLEEKFEINVETLQKTLTTAMKLGMSFKIDAQGNKIPINLNAVVSAAGEINKMNGNYASDRLKLREIDAAARLETDLSGGIDINVTVVSAKNKNG